MTKLMKKSVLLLLTLLILLAVGSLTAYAAPTQDENGVYQISSEEELYWFADEVNSGQTDISAKLMNDIVIQTGVLNTDGSLNGGTFEPWTPIGSYGENGEMVYTGTFDGGGYTISGLYCAISSDSDDVYAGLFGYSSGTIQNVKIADSYISAEANDELGDAYAGGICANNSGTIQNVNLEDSYVYAYGDDDAYAGGICAENSSSITDCSNSGTISSITGTNDINVAESGGICGYNEERGVIKNCYNTGTISSESEISRAGGICGNNDGKITKCTNSGYIYAVNDGSNEEIYAGGICGQSSNEISDCSNSGQVRAVGIGAYSSSYAGGICGHNGSNFSDGDINYCSNSGQITVTDYEEIQIEKGGITGSHSYGEINNCYFLENTADEAFGSQYSGTITNVEKKSEEDYTNGGVLGLLNAGQSPEPFVQGSDGFPLPKLSVAAVILNETELTLIAGESETLEAVVIPEVAYDKNLEWESSDENVATVDENGKITALNAGMATITVKSKDGSDVSAACEVTVKGKITAEANPAEGGTIEGTGDYEKGEEVTLTATAKSGYRFVNWTENGTVIGTEEEYSFEVEDNRHLTANFKKISGTVQQKTLTFDTNGGSKISALTENYGKTIVLADYTPKRDGYEFLGWYKDKELTEKIEYAVLDYDMTVYAKWQKIEETVDYDTLIVLTINDKTSIVNGEAVKNDVAPLIVNSRTYTPARFVAEALGAKVVWDEKTRTVTITKDDTTIILTIDSTTAYVNGEAVKMDAAAFIADGRTFTPARFVAENLGASVEWDEEARTVTIWQ